ncbi:hypothetical protein LJY25_04040 [Hymenobacter sp. BT175]|uniref:hypothetical protein n=1 Tax=Hymenobacter translucens TaxID=2886507 RepID=UPI001D0E9C7A|nr:hypothetical protein [Hymenobacter translucens]MCC2545603.1 hypothetical protein [Hymenobacter translucens]
MHSVLIACRLLFLSPNALSGAEPSGFATAVLQVTPERAFTTLCNDAAEVLRRALAEPNDAKALALLQSGSTPILKRKQQLAPAFSKWIKTLSPPQRQSFAQRIMVNNGMIKYLQLMEHDKKLNARIERNPKLMAAVTNLTAVMQMEVETPALP